MLIIQITENIQGAKTLTHTVNNKTYSYLEYLQARKGYLVFNMCIYDEIPKGKHTKKALAEDLSKMGLTVQL